jgi:hypothetical protein
VARSAQMLPRGVTLRAGADSPDIVGVGLRRQRRPAGGTPQAFVGVSLEVTVAQSLADCLHARA